VPSSQRSKACAELADSTYAALIDETTAAARADEILSTPTFIMR
jgi:hypothetical protein